MRIRKRDNGLFLGKFETKEEASEYIDNLVNRYKYTVYKNNMSILRILEEAKKEGVSINRGTFTSHLKKLKVPIKKGLNRKRSTKTKATFYLNIDVLEELDSFDEKSYLVDLGLRLVLSLPTEDLLVFFPHKKEEDRLEVIFRKNTPVSAIVMGNPNEKDMHDIRTLLKLGTEKGMKALKEYFDMFNYKYYGGNTW